MSRPVWVDIDLGALLHNTKLIRQIAPHSAIMAVIKDDAYGHGLLETAKTLQLEVEAFAVTTLESALTLRQAGIKQRLVLLQGFFSADELQDIASYQIDTVVHCDEQIAMLEKTIIPKPITIWVKINTGLNRLGFAPNKVVRLYQHLQRLQQVNEQPGLLSHFACADDLTSPMTEQQINSFNETVNELPGPRSLAASAGILAYPHSHQDWLRPGALLYGLSPIEDIIAQKKNLLPVMTLRSQLIAVNEVAAGEAIGYGATWQCQKKTRVGVVAVGYGDGYPRHVTNGTPVLVNNKRVELVGRVSMDMITINLNSQPEAQVGDEVILWGKNLPIEEIAKCANTNPRVLTTTINKQRVPFRYLSEQATKPRESVSSF